MPKKYSEVDLINCVWEAIKKGGPNISKQEYTEIRGENCPTSSTIWRRTKGWAEFREKVLNIKASTEMTSVSSSHEYSDSKLPKKCRTCVWPRPPYAHFCPFPVACVKEEGWFDERSSE